MDGRHYRQCCKFGTAGWKGVDGAIHSAGGPEIMEQCMEIRKQQGGCPPGNAVITGAGRLPAQHIIHTVGPIWEGGGRREEHTLAECYRNSLLLAIEVGARSIAFPNISTGIYEYPKAPACDVALKAVTELLEEDLPDNRLDRIDFVCFLLIMKSFISIGLSSTHRRRRRKYNLIDVHS